MVLRTKVVLRPRTEQSRSEPPSYRATQFAKLPGRTTERIRGRRKIVVDRGAVRRNAGLESGHRRGCENNDLRSQIPRLPTVLGRHLRSSLKISTRSPMNG